IVGEVALGGTYLPRGLLRGTGQERQRIHGPPLGLEDLGKLNGVSRDGAHVCGAPRAQLFPHPAQVALGGTGSKGEQAQRDGRAVACEHYWGGTSDSPPAVTSNSSRRFLPQAPSS